MNGDKRVFVDENELQQTIRDQVDKEKKELIRLRDLLWCKALLNSGLDPREMQKVLAKFNRARPDKKLKGELLTTKPAHLKREKNS